MTVLGGITPSAFLRDYWQKKPLLVRGAFPEWSVSLLPQDLLSLACREEVLSRLILEDIGEYPWELQIGPFEPRDFADLPDRGWTILVGDVDQHLPAVKEVLTPFRFLPNWRIDDVQVSYAPPGGNAGPHVDNYDVFLIQGYGQRRWQISHTPAPEDAAFEPDLDIALLQDFVPDTEWILSPGDLLYLPPRLPHWGVAVDHCMTYSVGFRAPTAQDILYGLMDAVQSEGAVRFADAERAPSKYPGRIEASDLAWVRRAVAQFIATGEGIDRWFGTYITQSAETIEPPEDAFSASDLADRLTSGYVLRRRSVGYLAHIEGTDQIRLYACGREYTFESGLTDAVRLLTGTQPLTLYTLGPYLGAEVFVRALATLVNMGCMVLERR